MKKSNSNKYVNIYEIYLWRLNSHRILKIGNKEKNSKKNKMTSSDKEDINDEEILVFYPKDYE